MIPYKDLPPDQFDAAEHLRHSILIMNERLENARIARDQLLTAFAKLVCPYTPGDVIRIENYLTRVNEFVVVSINAGTTNLEIPYRIIARTLRKNYILGECRTFDPSQYTLTIIDRYSKEIPPCTPE